MHTVLAGNYLSYFWRGRSIFWTFIFYMYHLQTSNPLGLSKNNVAVFHDFLTPPSTIAPPFITMVHQFLHNFWPLRPKTKRWRRHLWTTPFKIVILRSLWIDVKEVHIVKCKLYTIIVSNVFQLFFCKQHLS